tara:strand:+ start:4658 stop:4960 length:303 start_codon:yes stop_codon:yes gene_type:complete
MGCASNPDNMRAKHHSSLQYQGADCAVLAADLDGVNHEIDGLHRELERLYGNDIWQFWGGLLLLWPLWFFLEFGDWSDADRYKELLGKRDALEKSMAKCG